MDFKEIMMAVILLFILTLVFYSGDPIYTGFLAKWVTMMNSDQQVYDTTLRNWRLTVPAFLFVIVMMVLKATRKKKYGGI